MYPPAVNRVQALGGRCLRSSKTKWGSVGDRTAVPMAGSSRSIIDSRVEGADRIVSFATGSTRKSCAAEAVRGGWRRT